MPLPVNSAGNRVRGAPEGILDPPDLNIIVEVEIAVLIEKLPKHERALPATAARIEAPGEIGDLVLQDGDQNIAEIAYFDMIVKGHVKLSNPS
jgi:hypothetical protein